VELNHQKAEFRVLAHEVHHLMTGLRLRRGLLARRQNLLAGMQRLPRSTYVANVSDDSALCPDDRGSSVAISTIAELRTNLRRFGVLPRLLDSRLQVQNRQAR
jgi:hypothetical protein